jgi:hypothetical protein
MRGAQNEPRQTLQHLLRVAVIRRTVPMCASAQTRFGMTRYDFYVPRGGGSFHIRSGASVFVPATW